MKTACVIQHIAVETPGAIADALSAAGVQTKTFLRSPPASLTGFDCIVVMGGPQSVYEQDKFPFLRDELRLIESALEAGKPVLGVCLGSQLLAAALGARVYAGKQKEIGWYPVALSKEAGQDALWKGAPATFMAYHWHGDVFDLPAGAVSLARSELTAHQAFRYGANAYGFLFHMEVTGAMVAEMVTDFAGELHEAGIDARGILGGAKKHLPGLREVGAMVFGRWAQQAAS
jgi:GMP synthase (glutamine-hydrolysing)